MPAGAFAGDWTTLPPFEAPPEALLAAAAALPRDEPADVHVLLEEVIVRLDAEGRRAQTRRLVYTADTVGGAEGWGSVGAWWSPWHEERPVVDARVIRRDGTVHRLDPSHLGEAVDPGMDPLVFTDVRLLRGPLPQMEAGVVVEEVWTTTEHRPFLPEGTITSVPLAGDVPVARTRVVVEVADGLPFRWEVRGADLEPTVGRGKGVRRLELDLGPREADDTWEPFSPPDVTPPALVLSTGKSWSAMAGAYSRMIEERLAGVDLSERAAAVTKGITDPHERMAALLAEVQGSIRYVGIEFGMAAILPSAPPDVVGRGYGDCKDMSTLLVGLLRASGFEAEVALLKTGPGPDVSPELPGLDRFDHAIVHVGGEYDLWIDPTSDFAGLGDLPLMDQGRLALIASPKTKQLVTISRLGAEANTYRAVVEIDLASSGRASIRETRTFTGWPAQEIRPGYAESDATDITEHLGRRAEHRFESTETPTDSVVSDPRDLKTPLTISFRVDGALEAASDDDEALVRGHWADALDWLPWLLTTEPEGDAEPRRNAVVFPPSIAETERRIHLPPGYVVGELPAEETGSVGPIAWSRRWEVGADGTTVGRIRVETGDGRLAAEQLAEVRDRILALANEDYPILHFEHAAAVAFRERRYGDALAIHRDLLAASPDDPVLATRWAFALLQAGLGDAAGEAMAHAVALSPDDPWTLNNHGRVLLHDVDGRTYGRGGFDRAGAQAAFEKAITLDPDEPGHYHNLAELAAMGDDGVLFGEGSDVEAAIATLRTRRERTGAKDLDAVLADYLLHEHRWEDVRALAKEMPEGPDRHKLDVLTTAMLDGRSAAVAQAKRLAGGEQRGLLHQVATELMNRRRYQDAAAFLEIAATGAPNAVQLRQLARLLEVTVPFDEMEVDPDDPADIYVRLVQAAMAGDNDGVRATLAKSLHGDEGDDLVAEFAKGLNGVVTAENGTQMPADVLLDLAMSMMDASVEGDASGGWRVVYRGPDGKEMLTVYVVKERGACRARVIGPMPAEMGAEALVRARKNDLDGARRWLGWAWDQYREASGDDPYTGTPFTRVWRGGVDADAARIRISAALLAAGDEKRAPEAIETLLAEREKAQDPTLSLQIDRSLTVAYGILERWDEALAAADRLAAQSPTAIQPLQARVFPLVQLDRGDEARTEVTARLKAKPDDVDLLRLSAGLAEGASDFDAAARAYERVIALGKGTAHDFNQLAWFSLRDPALIPQGLAWSMQGNQHAAYGHQASLHTLATLLVETGRPEDAREVLVQALASPTVEVHHEAWQYVRGRLAEAWALPDVASSLYARIPAPGPEAKPYDISVLTKGRLEALASRP